ncbi:MAG: cobalamin biosynthesis protein CobD [Reyranella sp.]|nr:cobalamin biosynthesis protein CobD [Reyranella sp.]
MFAGLALVAVVVEAAVGYPDALYRAIGHPVSWMGRLIAWCDALWNSPTRSFDERRGWGMATLALLLVVTIIVAVLVVRLCQALPGLLEIFLCAVVASSLLAQRSLHDHVAEVATALERRGIEAGREAVSRIVGRDTSELDEAAIGRAAIESLAENFSDGVVAPLFWMVVAGLPGAAAYKAVNTADSMIGHKSERHHAFGWASARLDDLVNLPASRLAALWIMLAAAFRAGCSVDGAIAAVRRDARHHRSPNAGWPESAMAGALGIRLAGPRVYSGVKVEDRWIGVGRAELTAADIRNALGLYRAACGVQIAVVALLTLILFG